MAVGAKDKIDKKLVQMYANTQTTNYDTSSKVDPEKILQSMTLLAMNNRTYFEVQKARTATRKSNLDINSQPAKKVS